MKKLSVVPGLGREAEPGLNTSSRTRVAPGRITQALPGYYKVVRPPPAGVAAGCDCHNFCRGMTYDLP